MDITEMLANLVLDLKMTLDSEISTAEGTRAIKKAVDELSRHVPKEEIYEHTWVKAVTDDDFTTPAAASATSIVSAMDISASVDGDTATLATTWHDVPRPCKMTLTDANNSVTRMTVIIKGTDANGAYREERFYRFNGKIQTGKIMFYSISEVEINEIAGNGAADTLSIGTDSPDLATGGIWIQLDNPIEVGKETIYSGAGKTGTKYTLNTDYEMDYANGRIRMKNGGSLAASTIYYANYDRAPTSIDISSIMPKMIRVSKVLYPADNVPEQQVDFSIWENMLTIGSPRPTVSQEALSNEKHIAIYYEANQTPPTLVGPGSYPEFLDEVVLVGAAGHALLMEALQYELQAVTDLASMRTELTKVTILVTPTTGKIDLALTKVALYLETAGTTDNAVDVLSNVTDDVTSLRTAINTALDAAAAFIAEVDTTDLGQATVGAEGLLETGDGLINQLNDGGPDVADKYADFARARAQIGQVRTQAALAFAQEAGLRLSNLRSYIEEAGGWNRIGETFIGEAQTLVAEVNAIIAEANQYYEAAGLDLILADRFRAEGTTRLTEFRTVLSSKSEYRKRIVSASVRQPR